MKNVVINTWICYSKYYKLCKIYECSDGSFYVEYKGDDLEMEFGSIDALEAYQIVKQNG